MGSGEKKHISPSLSAYSFADRKGRFGRYMLLFGAQGTIALLLRGYLVARARWLYRGRRGEIGGYLGENRIASLATGDVRLY